MAIPQDQDGTEGKRRLSNPGFASLFPGRREASSSALYAPHLDALSHMEPATGGHDSQNYEPNNSLSLSTFSLGHLHSNKTPTQSGLGEHAFNPKRKRQEDL